MLAVLNYSIHKRANNIKISACNEIRNTHAPIQRNLQGQVARKFDSAYPRDRVFLGLLENLDLSDSG